MIYGLGPALYSAIGLKLSFPSISDAFVRERAELFTLTGWLVQGLAISILAFCAWRAKPREEKAARGVAPAEV